MDPPYFLQLQNKKLKRWNSKKNVDAVNDDWDKIINIILPIVIMAMIIIFLKKKLL